jgi:hypothetical protein
MKHTKKRQVPRPDFDEIQQLVRLPGCIVYIRDETKESGIRKVSEQGRTVYVRMTDAQEGLFVLLNKLYRVSRHFDASLADCEYWIVEEEVRGSAA